MTERSTVVFNRPRLAGREMEYVADAVRRGQIACGGWYTRQCEEVLQAETGSGRVLLTTSCTHALEMSAYLLDAGPGDEIVVPAFTFVSTANAFAVRGARPVFADIRPDTLNLDESRLEALLTPRTKAVVPVHYGGVACEMDAILAIAHRRGVAVVEDAAHGLFGAWRGRALGSMGRMATLSFHETKNVTCGEGGALLLNDPALVARAEVIRAKGTDRARFERGEVPQYTWRDVGSSYAPPELAAAFLLAQLEERARIQAARRRIWETYRNGLAGWAEHVGARLPHVPDGASPAWHLFHVLVPSAADRDAFIAHLAARGVESVFHYVPLHLSEMGRKLGGREGDCPVAEDVSRRLVRLPMHAGLTEADVERVVDAATSFHMR